MASTPPPERPVESRPLTVPLLVRGEFDKRLLGVLLVMSAAFAAFGIKVRIDNPWDPCGPTLIWALSAAVAVPMLVRALWKWPQRRWLEVTLTGFVLSSRKRKHTFSDDHVVGVARTWWITSGNVVQHRILIDLRTTELSDRVVCTYSVLPGLVDPLAAFWDRLTRGLSNRLRDRQSQGEQLIGDGWHVDLAGLRHRMGVVALERISYVGPFERCLCLWKDDEERPFLRIPLASRNVQSLHVFLLDRLLQGPNGMRALPNNPLGRILLDRRARDWILGVVILVLGLITCGVLFGVALSQRDRPSTLMVAYPLGIALAALALGGFFTWKGVTARLIFHERGVVQFGRGGTKTLLYNEIGTVIWKPGPSITLRPRPGVDRPEIRYRSSLGIEDLDLGQMRTWMCVPMAMRWREELQNGPVKWTERLRFLPGGLEYSTASLLGDGETVTVPYHLTRFQIAHGTFYLFTTERASAVCTERTSVVNFFPGLLLLTMIYGQFRQVLGPEATSVARGDVPRDERIVGEEERFRT